MPSAKHLAAATGLIALLGTAHAGGLEATVGRLEEAFRHSRAEELRRVLSPQRKTYLDLPCLWDQEGFVSSDQTFYLFERFFDQHPTESFAVVRIERDDGDETATARASWRYRTAAAEARSEPLLLTLGREEERWVVTEIRALGP
jgi:hypothetical protein